MLLSEHDPSWSDAFEAVAARLREAVGDQALAIVHVGSTAVPGLVAKPILDVDLVISDDPAAFLPVQRRLWELGYRSQGDLGIPGRHAFGRENESVPWGGGRTNWMEHNLYVCRHSCSELDRHLRFRDRLVGNTAWRDQYARIKKELEALSGGDRRAYALVKAAEGVCDRFVDAALDQRLASPLPDEQLRVSALDPTLAPRLVAHPWGSGRLGQWLLALQAADEARAIRAAEELWNAVAHQGNVETISVEVLPFLLEGLARAVPAVQEELLDILCSFADAAIGRCGPEVEVRPGDEWACELRHLLNEARPRFATLACGPQREVAEWAASLLDSLGEFETDALELRPYESTDEERFVALVTDPAIRRHFEGPEGEEQARLLFRRFLDHGSPERHRCWLVVRKAAGEEGSLVAGHAWLTPNEQSAELGVLIDPACWNRGYATQVVSTLLDHAHRDLSVPQVIATVDEDHRACRRMLEKAGMTFAGLRADDRGSYCEYRSSV